MPAPGRIEPEIALSDKWAKRLGVAFYALTAFKICGSLAVPFLLSLRNSISHTSLFAGVLGVLVALCEAFTTSYSLKERFIAKRLECEDLKSELELYIAKAGTYAKPGDVNGRLVERTEEIIARFGDAWRKNVASMDSRRKRGK